MSTNSNNLFKDFGQALLFVLDNKRLSQSDFAEKWGKDRAQISKYVNNISTPRPKTLQEIEDLLNVRFINVDDEWRVYLSDNALKAIDALDSVQEQVTGYLEQEPTLDDLPELIRLRQRLDEMIQKLIE